MSRGGENLNASAESEYRYEIKFAHASFFGSHLLIEAIKQHPAIFREIYAGRRVNNIYFDTVDYLTVNDNVSGYADREKSHCLDASYYKGGNANMLRSYIQKSKRQIVFGDGCNQVGIADDINGQDIIKRIYSIEGKCPTLTTMQGGHREPKIAVDDLHWRKLTPLECERLQTVPDGYTEGVSNTQRYKMLGNGWTVDVISHIMKGMEV